MGHLNTVDVYEDPFLENKCGTGSCKADIVWTNGVDQTNDEGFPFTNFIELKPAKYEECDKCNHRKLVEHARYIAPTNEEMEQYYKEREEFYSNLYSHLLGDSDAETAEAQTTDQGNQETQAKGQD
jgi:hypothetical protein